MTPGGESNSNTQCCRCQHAAAPGGGHQERPNHTGLRRRGKADEECLKVGFVQRGIPFLPRIVEDSERELVPPGRESNRVHSHQ